MKVDGSVNSLIQGVSQQPTRIRLPGQCTQQDNFTSNPVTGLTRRPPTALIKELFTTAVTDMEWFDFNVGGVDYIAVTDTASIRVFDLQGTEYTVDIVSGASYLDGGSMRIGKLEDDVFIVNPRVKVSMIPGANPNLYTQGMMIYCKGGSYGTVYSANIDYTVSGTPHSVTATFTTPDGSNASHASQVTPGHIITSLRNSLTSNGTFNSNWDTYIAGSVLYLRPKNAATTLLTSYRVTDAQNGTQLLGIDNQVRNVSDLPPFAVEGYVLKVVGQKAGGADDYYLRFDTPTTNTVGTGFGNAGAWVECTSPTEDYRLDSDTMPHVLWYDDLTDKFVFQAEVWEPRKVGDNLSNPVPSFVGKALQDTAAFQGRLAFITGENFITSRSNKTYDMWIETATAQTDTDPIDIYSTAPGIGDMLYLVPFDKDMYIFASGGQFLLSGRTVMTPRTAALMLNTTFEFDENVRPITAGRNVTFSTQYGKFSGIREYYSPDIAGTNDARTITQHVSKFIVGRVDKITSSTSVDVQGIVTYDDPNIMYVYEYIWKEDTKLQSSWSRWIFNKIIHHSFIIGSELYMIMQDENGTIALNRLGLNQTSDEGLDYIVYLDDKHVASGVNTFVTKPYTNDYTDIIIVQGEGCPYPGLRVRYTTDNNGDFTLLDDMQGGDVIIGRPFKSEYTPSTPVILDGAGNKQDYTKFIIKQYKFNYIESGSMYATIKNKYRDDVTIELGSRQVASPSSLIGESSVSSGDYVVPLRDNSDFVEVTIHTASHLPLTLLSIAYSGQVYGRSTRVNVGNGGG